MPMIIFGDSIGISFGASDPAHMWFNILASRLRVTMTNYSVSGAQCADQGMYYRAQPYRPGAIYLTELGTNDSGMYRDDPDKQDAYVGCMVDMLSWLTLSPDRRDSVADGNVQLHGSWVDSPYWTNGGKRAFGKLSRQVGDYAEWTGQGTACYVGTTLIDGNTAGFSISDNGQILGFPTNAGRNGASITTQWKQPYAPYAIRLPNLPKGQHVIRITVEKADSMNPVYFDWIGCNGNDGSPAPGAPTVLDIGITRQFDPGPTPNQPWLDDHIHSYQVLKEAVDYDLRVHDGLSVLTVNEWNLMAWPAQYCSTTCRGGDGVHLNDAGYAIYADQLITLLSPYYSRVGPAQQGQ